MQIIPNRQAARVSSTPGATETQKRWCHAAIDRQLEHMSLLPTEASGSRQSYQDRLVEITAADTGIGISAQALPNLFQMFSQVQSTMDRSERGLGIGLALANGLIELHGGSIQAQSAGPGPGSEFAIRLACVAITEPGDLDVNDADEMMRIAPQRVLIADDNRDAAESLGMLLRMDGHEVIVTHDGPGALSAFGDFDPDIVILDIGMPGQNGYEVARQMRERIGDKPLKLIAVTGWGQDNDREKALQAGFDSHLTKPVDPESLTKLMQDDARSTR
jgi:CheY-like chemotaxis protein